MKSYTLINLLTAQMITLEANSRLHARSKVAARSSSPSNHIVYWIEKQSYHNTDGYELLA